MNDFESCFCDTVLKVSEPIVDKGENASLIGLRRHLVKRVMTPRTLKRFLTNFIGSQMLTNDLGCAYIAGIEESYQKLSQIEASVFSDLYETARNEPRLLVGYGNYRRPLEFADVDRMRQRLQLGAKEITPYVEACMTS